VARQGRSETSAVCWTTLQLRICLADAQHTYTATVVIAEQAAVLQLVKKFPTFYGPRNITMFTGANHLSLTWATLTRYMLSCCYYHIFIQIVKGSLSLQLPI